ncbi:PspC domain-containing protein [Thermoanaerobacter sp. CM-CNRG TB177]|uniref:PspC domain-containing protein n=1 Tax=Thermoanaerobacter sp. CM-CNRG TB177 TaxID=2800659 RepID=UPI001BDE6BCC|nr:PspC domain-containing protein [Thermoanaerobacter sp. CM-CNRG TB177]MBT1278983.1 PspC domain-containing protein [Thermoanaerobacter sp. CM-CNRG TB177]
MEKRLVRSRKNRMIGGVCGGIAEHLGTDPTVVRLIWAVTTLFWGTGIILYLLAWAVIPEEK